MLRTNLSKGLHCDKTVLRIVTEFKKTKYGKYSFNFFKNEIHSPY